ncbi:TetR/AcrR family transcriptional regulator [Nocardioides carbamazepini]|uniref:TetR/AcrR family transcriptional regulator n=1 Tax=Nocardioides carbamazepini TaxID=2854259 RepID=UPI002149EDA8|nr:TetR/AcrR family transcriptional regulator [Nocardioides carbamazepini]MCR1785244.1 TetR/AcrR family transcriptional regulator [Nocardioides carbamazepini]
MPDLCSPNRREAKRVQTALRLQECGLQLTLEKGFDGWTIDDLAVAADVSRRTVFNYFDGKADVVLGPGIEVDQAKVDAFVAGGPTGRLFDDLIELAHEAVRDRTDEHLISLLRDAVVTDPRLLALVHTRLEEAATGFAECVRQREGDDFPSLQSRLLLKLLLTFFDNALDRTAEDPDRTFSEHFDATVADARSALA